MWNSTDSMRCNFSLLDFGVVRTWNMSNTKSIGEETAFFFVNLIFYCRWQYCALMFCRGTHFELYVVADLGPLTQFIVPVIAYFVTHKNDDANSRQSRPEEEEEVGKKRHKFLFVFDKSIREFQLAKEPLDLNGDTHSVCSSMVTVWLLSCTRQTFHIPMNAFYLWSVQNKCAIQSNSALLSPASCRDAHFGCGGKFLSQPFHVQIESWWHFVC